MASNNIVSTERIPGFIIETDERGNRTSFPVANLLRSEDIPTGLTFTQVGAITTLANLVAVLIRTLIDRDVLNDDFLEGGAFNLESITEAIAEISGAYDDPDISVS